MAENIGNKIKSLREESGRSISELAEAAGIKESHLELIEKGEVIPSISTMIKLSRCFGVRLGTILDGSEHFGPVVTVGSDSGTTTNREGGNTTPESNYGFRSLAQRKTDRNMEPFIIEVKYSSNIQSDGSAHEGEEFIYVLEGEVELHYGSEKYSLKAGDSIYYDSLVHHLLSSAKPETTAKVLAVTYAPY